MSKHWSWFGVGALALTVLAGGLSLQAAGLSADLSVCSRKDALAASQPADLKDFVARLNGTWLLRRRTIEGVTIDTDSKFYFDIDSVGDRQASGRALMFDRGNLTNLDPLKRCKACLVDATVGALWKVDVRLGEDGQAVSLTMDGEYLGSYGDFAKGMTATEKTVFYRRGEVYLADNLVSPAGGQGLADDTWDRISLTPGVLVYVSCRSRFVDRFVKLSGAKPSVDGLALGDAWAARKKDGSLVNPSLGRSLGK